MMKTNNYWHFIFVLYILTVCSCQPGKAPAVNPEHRFEFTNCEAFYNGQKLPFMQPLSEWVKIFGPYDADNGLGFFRWYDIPMSLAIVDYQDSLVKEVRIVFGLSLNEKDPYPKKFEGSIMVNGVLLNRNTRIEKFNRLLKNNNEVEFVPFLNSDSHYWRQFYLKSCKEETGQSIYLNWNDLNTIDLFIFYYKTI